MRLDFYTGQATALENQILQNSVSNSQLRQASSAVVSSGPDLVPRFGTITLPDTINYGDDGSAQLIVTNNGNAVAQGPITVNLWISTDRVLDKASNPWTPWYSDSELLNYRNDALLKSVVQNINLNPGQSVTIDLPYENITSVVAPGAYQLIGEIDADNAIAELQETNNIVTKQVSAPGTDVVIDWISAALNAIQAEGKAGRGVAPTVGSRLMAITSAAVYDAVNAFENSHTPYKVDIDPPAGASKEAAVVGAAYTVLVNLIPNQARMLQQQMMECMREITDSSVAESLGMQFGRTVAQQMLGLRSNDGSNNNAPYVPPGNFPTDYVWEPEASGPNQGVAVGPNWGGVTPFALSSVAQFPPDGLDGRPDTNPDLYATEIEEVRLKGGQTSTEEYRSPDQAEMAIFWAADRADTFRPYGQVNQIAAEIAVQEGNSLIDNARLFAALNIALADAVIVAWDAKYQEVQPRPDDVIAGGFALNDGLDETVHDPNWKPLISEPINGSPPFPDYISGHSSMGGTFAGVMTEFFGDDLSFDAVSQELPGVIRNFDGFYEEDGITFRNSFYEAGLEDAFSRIYGGVHVREACIEAFNMGQEVGHFVATNLLQPLG